MTQGAERVEELEYSVWRVVRHKNERDDQEEGVGIRDSDKTGTATSALEKAQEKKWEIAEMRMLYDGCAKLRSWTKSEIKELG